MGNPYSKREIPNPGKEIMRIELISAEGNGIYIKQPYGSTGGGRTRLFCPIAIVLRAFHSLPISETLT